MFNFIKLQWIMKKITAQQVQTAADSEHRYISQEEANEIMEMAQVN
jgi:hypothetical protein